MIPQYQAAIDRAYRSASKAPALEISSSDPADTATGVPVNKTMTLIFSVPLHSPNVDNTNITITPNVARTTSLDAVNYKIVTIDPTSNLALGFILSGLHRWMCGRKQYSGNLRSSG